jgi:hypothetical protein
MAFMLSTANKPIMLSVVMLNVIMLSVIMLNAVMRSIMGLAINLVTLEAVVRVKLMSAS